MVAARQASPRGAGDDDRPVVAFYVIRPWQASEDRLAIHLSSYFSASPAPDEVSSGVIGRRPVDRNPDGERRLGV